MKKRTNITTIDEMKEKLGEDKIHAFRRSWDIKPDPLNRNNPYHPLNIEVYKKIKGLGAFDQYVIIPGNGINIQAWQAIATLYNVPINFAKRESYAKSFGRGLKRFIKRLSLIYLKLFFR